MIGSKKYIIGNNLIKTIKTYCVFRKQKEVDCNFLCINCNNYAINCSFFMINVNFLLLFLH